MTCPQCGAAPGTDHRTDQGQHDVTATFTVELPPLAQMLGLVPDGE